MSKCLQNILPVSHLKRISSDSRWDRKILHISSYNMGLHIHQLALQLRLLVAVTYRGEINNIQNF